MKTHPQVPAALVGLYPGASAVCPTIPALGKMLVVVQYGEGSYNLLDSRCNITQSDAASLSLLLDSPLAMCHAARWLARQRGHPPVPTAPEWSVELDSDGTLCWRLRSGDEDDWFPTIDADLSDAEALAAACLAVGGAK